MRRPPSVFAPRGGGSVGPSGILLRETPRAGTRRGSTIARRRVPEGARAAGDRRRARPPRPGWQASAPSPRRGAGSAWPGRTNASRRFGSRTECGARRARRRPAGRRPTTRDRDGDRSRLAREDARHPQCGTAPRAPRGDRIAVAVLSPRARLSRPPRGSPSSQAHALEGEEPALQCGAGRAVAADPVRRDDAMARDDERVPVVRTERSGRPSRARPPGERSQLAVRDDLAPRNRPCRGGQLVLERRRPVEIDDDSLVRRGIARRDGRRCAGTDPTRSRRSRGSRSPGSVPAGSPAPPSGGAVGGLSVRCPRIARNVTRRGSAAPSRSRESVRRRSGRRHAAPRRRARAGRRSPSRTQISPTPQPGTS